MKNEKEIQFITTNYYNLQGLRLIPLGLLLMYVGYWANTSHFPVDPKGLLNLLAVMVIIILAGLAINIFYKRLFGVVKQTPESRRLETQLWTVGAFLATIAFWLDVSYKLPLSLVGLIAGLALVADYLRMTWLVKGRFLIYYPISAIVIILVSLLPLFGLPGWWKTLGLRTQMFGVVLFVGLFIVITGVCSHIFLAKTLHINREAK